MSADNGAAWMAGFKTDYDNIYDEEESS